jgi:class I fructose-bisphosphate aldolase
MKSYRLNRLFHPVSKKCFNVAIDHGFFGKWQIQGFHWL